MPAPALTGKSNPLAKRVRLAASGSRRASGDLVLAEGIRVLEEATVSGYEIDAVLFTERFGNTERGRALLSQWQAKNAKIYRAAGPLLKSLSDVLSPQGALALVRVPVMDLAGVRLGANPLVLCACGIQDPGNLGSLLRAAAAAGVEFFCTTAGTVSARNPKCIRASAGAFFRLPAVENLHPAAFLAFCRSRKVRVFRADARGGTPYSKTDLTKATALVLGSESHGARGPEWAGVPAVRIPMFAGIESLNVAGAGAVLLFEARRQRAAS